MINCQLIRTRLKVWSNFCYSSNKDWIDIFFLNFWSHLKMHFKKLMRLINTHLWDIESFLWKLKIYFLEQRQWLILRITWNQFLKYLWYVSISRRKSSYLCGISKNLRKDWQICCLGIREQEKDKMRLNILIMILGLNPMMTIWRRRRIWIIWCQGKLFKFGRRSRLRIRRITKKYRKRSMNFWRRCIS